MPANAAAKTIFFNAFKLSIDGLDSVTWKTGGMTPVVRGIMHRRNSDETHAENEHAA
ncbi:MAG: hypothetical protein NVSMB28_01950 [Collimonas sp.]